ncbi:MAG: hypothetical protein DRP91_08310 [Candidatus Neomarinimicrobiota bacterium]|nr:MAG: hypothetical protein DRP91_08310 [Candidatus Neomarinimicrobiota bacterium]
MPVFKGISDLEKNYVLRKIMEIEKKLSRTVSRSTSPNFDPRIFEYNTKDFWDIELKKGNETYEAKILIKFLDQSFRLSSSSLFELMKKIEDKIMNFKKDFTDWLRLMAK